MLFAPPSPRQAEHWAGYPAYGQMRERDQIGVFERIGPEHCRLVIPWPKPEAKLEILEPVR